MTSLKSATDRVTQCSWPAISRVTFETKNGLKSLVYGWVRTVGTWEMSTNFFTFLSAIFITILSEQNEQLVGKCKPEGQRNQAVRQSALQSTVEKDSIDARAES